LVFVVWDDPVIRICQFHVVQAVGRADFWSSWDGTEDSVAKPLHVRENKQSKKRTKTQSRRKLAVSTEARSDFVQAFRILQRYRAGDTEPFEAHFEQFKQRIQRATVKHGIPEASSPVISYFQKNWLSPLWRSM
jgi:hypothetical protein